MSRIDNHEERVGRAGGLLHRVQAPTYRRSIRADKPTLNAGEQIADPPVRCETCRGRISVLPCRLCRLRSGQRFDKPQTIETLRGLHRSLTLASKLKAESEPDDPDAEAEEQLEADFETPL